jgi:hypothetical protein
MTPISSLDNPYFYGAKAYGTAIGTLFLAGFGAIWMAIALRSLNQLHVLQIAFIALLVCGLAASSFYTFQHTRKLANHASNDLWRKKSNRVMGIVNVAQWCAIFLCVNMLNHYHRQALVVPAIILIVGIHFLPLARLFHSLPNGMTGIFMIAWAILYPLLLPASLADSVGAMVTGILLLSCAAVHAWVATNLARELSSETSQAVHAGLQPAGVISGVVPGC